MHAFFCICGEINSVCLQMCLAAGASAKCLTLHKRALFSLTSLSQDQASWCSPSPLPPGAVPLSLTVMSPGQARPSAPDGAWLVYDIVSVAALSLCPPAPSGAELPACTSFCEPAAEEAQASGPLVPVAQTGRRQGCARPGCALLQQRSLHFRHRRRR